jgi:hypothetical protein
MFNSVASTLANPETASAQFSGLNLEIPRFSRLKVGISGSGMTESSIVNTTCSMELG